jgi:hypothetical protein
MKILDQVERKRRDLRHRNTALALQVPNASSRVCSSCGPSVHPPGKYGNVDIRLHVDIHLTSRTMRMGGSFQSHAKLTHGWECPLELIALEGIMPLASEASANLFP